MDDHSLSYSLEESPSNRSSPAVALERIPQLAPVNHIFCWSLAALLGAPLFASKPQLYFVVYAVMNFGIFVWAVAVFVVSKRLVARLNAHKDYFVTPEIYQTRQLLTRFILASFPPSFLPSFLPSSFPWSLPSIRSLMSLPSLLPCFLPSFLPSFLPLSFLPSSKVPSFLPLSFFSSSDLPSFLPPFLPPFLPSSLPPFLPSSLP
jgi:hypothetical protein